MKLCKSDVALCKEYCRSLEEVDQREKGLNFINEIQSMINAWDCWPRNGYLVPKNGLKNNHVAYIISNLGLFNDPTIGCKVTEGSSVAFIKK